MTGNDSVPVWMKWGEMNDILLCIIINIDLLMITSEGRYQAMMSVVGCQQQMMSMIGDPWWLKGICFCLCLFHWNLLEEHGNWKLSLLTHQAFAAMFESFSDNKGNFTAFHPWVLFPNFILKVCAIWKDFSKFWYHLNCWFCFTFFFVIFLFLLTHQQILTVSHLVTLFHSFLCVLLLHRACWQILTVWMIFLMFRWFRKPLKNHSWLQAFTISSLINPLQFWWVLLCM